MTVTISSVSGIDWNADTVEQLKNDILNILRTRRGEVPFMPGLGLDEYIGEPVKEMIPAIRNDIAEQLSLWMPDIEIENIDVSVGADGDMKIEVVLT